MDTDNAGGAAATDQPATGDQAKATAPKAKAATPRSSQADPTKPRPTDEAGNVLDAWGLPIAGPLRIAALAERGIEDPALQPAPPVTE